MSARELENLLNRIGNFTCSISDEQMSFAGVLIREDNHIMLSAQMEIEAYRSAHGMSTIQIWGSVLDTSVTLLNCRIERYSCPRRVGEMGTVLIWPSEIIEGKCYDGEIMVKTISAEVPALNYFYMGGPLKHTFPDAENDYAVLRLEHTGTFFANDSTGDLEVRQTIQKSWSFDQVRFDHTPVVEYTFFYHVF